MCKFNELLPETKSEKAGALVWESCDDRNGYIPLAGILTLTGKRCHCSYKVEEFPADHGRGFALFKIEEGSDKSEERYFCLIGKHAKQCDCKGFTYAGHCKHTEALSILIAEGKL